MDESSKELNIDPLKSDSKLDALSRGRLASMGSPQIFDRCIKLLSSESPELRNDAALVLADLKDNRAVEPLLAAIFKPGNHNKNGTLVFALQDLDCRAHVVELFRILCFESYEGQISAYDILCNQKFEIDEDSRREVSKMVDEWILQYGNSPTGGSDQVKEMILDASEKVFG